MGQGMTQPGGSNAGGFATEMAVGMAMAQQMIQQQGGCSGRNRRPPRVGTPPPMPTQPPSSASAASTIPELCEPGDVAMFSRSVKRRDRDNRAGDLKAKKIGSTWRITRAAVDEFLKS